MTVGTYKGTCFLNRTVTYGVWVDGNDDQIRFITANIFITIINKGVTFDETLSLRLFDSVKSAIYYFNISQNIKLKNIKLQHSHWISMSGNQIA